MSLLRLPGFTATTSISDRNVGLFRVGMLNGEARSASIVPALKCVNIGNDAEDIHMCCHRGCCGMEFYGRGYSVSLGCGF
jgi:hypothetical protein